MAENDPNPPPGAVPPKPSEAAKVQPKKETVRISLPPKPAATIKLPTLPGGPPSTSASRPAGAPGLAPRAGVAPAAKRMSALDGALAVVAAVVGLVAVYWVWNLLSMN